jgi:hypothetical protein
MSTPAIQGIRPAHILIQADVNLSIVMGDSTKEGLDATISVVAEEVFGFGRDGTLSYKDYVQKECYPGNKHSNDELRVKQEEMIGSMLEDLQEPQRSEAQRLHERLAEYRDPETHMANFKPFPSFVKLLNRAHAAAACTLTLRTFGPDGETVAGEIEQLRKRGGVPDKLAFAAYGDFSAEGVRLRTHGSASLQGEELFKTLLKTNIVGRDQIAQWKHNREAADGKRVYCAAEGIFDGQKVVTIFLDDNLALRSPTQQDVPPDPKEKNIAFPIDVLTGKAASWESPGLIGIKVNTLQAALDEDYLVNFVNSELASRGYASL